ncbi:helix-turn-helix domain-containing protein [uncultured Campylobacter sp.]|uniref:XRE family transcriptional regulator n=1 Tax=uncultured Campylobacter sp. TaxID=218934 RepID=UPI00261BD6E3|nr:helix-turn-helix domain-containing protein [uncultured Campylobacter sp.]
MDLAQKISFLRKEREWSQDELAKISGVGRSTIQLYESKKASKNPTRENLQKIANAFEISISDLANENFDVSIDVSDDVSIGKNDVSPSNLKETETDQIFIRKLSSSVGAGESVDINGIEIYDTDVLIPFSRMLFKVCPKNTSRIRCMPVEGYSMVPMLYPDSWVIVDVTAKFEGDGLYIVNYCDHFMVKLLQKSPDGVLHIKSVNKEYDSYEIGPDSDLQVYIVGKVLRCVI